MPAIATTPDVDRMIAADCPVAIGVSGGKDSDAAAIATVDHLDRVGHRGPRLLIHSDLGRVEWRDSLPACERLAALLGLDLVVVRRASGDMLDRWQGRWRANVARYRDLSCVKLILPWSTPSMRFCTSELKTDVICRDLVRRWPGRTILSVTGVRRDESTDRANAPVLARQKKLESTTHATLGHAWNPLVHWTLEDVLALAASRGLPRHEAYTKYGASRVSCAYCIMSKLADLRAAAGCEDNHDVYRMMVDLEIESTFGFQGSRWLADVAPHLLGPATPARVAASKRAAEGRMEAEKLIPKHLLYTKNWPTCLPTEAEAANLAIVRRAVAHHVGLDVGYTNGPDVRARYADLLALKAAKGKAEASDEEPTGQLAFAFN